MHAPLNQAMSILRRGREIEDRIYHSVWSKASDGFELVATRLKFVVTFLGNCRGNWVSWWGRAGEELVILLMDGTV